MCANIEQIKEIAIVDNKVEDLIRAFMPGPITLVLNKNPKFDGYINSTNLVWLMPFSSMSSKP